MKLRNYARAVALVLLLVSAALAGEKPKQISDETRKTLIRELNAENVFVKKFFPIGKIGLRIENGVVTPTDPEVRQLVADAGPAAKPGDRVHITAVQFVKKGIIFELNGGPVKKKKWYERIEVGSVGGSTAPMDKDPKNENMNARGSYVLLAFKDYVPELTTEQVKQMLDPVFDWNARTQAEAYEKTLPPKVRDAVKNHHALVGMDRDMVMVAMGRPPKKYRDHDGATEYEEWIYGEPPNDVNFIRFVGNEVIRIETMKVDGQKIVRNQREFNPDEGVSTYAKKEEPAKQENKSGPSLMRPGEKPQDPVTLGGANGRANSPPPSQTGPSSDPTAMPTGPDASQGPPGLPSSTIPGQGPPH